MCGAGCMRGWSSGATTITSAAPSIARRASWGPRMAARCFSQAVGAGVAGRLTADGVAARPRQRAAAGSAPRAGLSGGSPALRPTSRRCARSRRRPNNLPQQLTTFVGREREMAEVEAPLATSRLVTLSAPGDGQDPAVAAGRGRHGGRLSRRRLVRRAGAADDPGSCRRRSRRCSACREEPGRPLVATLLRAVGDRQLLLVLDNCEHLVARLRALAEALLQAGAASASSRPAANRCSIAGEAI